MRRVFNTLLLLIFLFSCGQKNANTEISKDASSTGKDEKVKQYTILPNSTEPTEPQNQAMEADTNCLYENEVSSLGKGLIYAPSVFELYNDSLLTDRFTTVDMHSGHTENNGICSKFFMPEYDIMQFVCLDSSQKSYKVLINYSDFKFLPKTKGYDFETWGNYILRSFGIRRITQKTSGAIAENQPLRKANNNNADTLSIPKGYEMFCPMEVRGDWVKVKYDCFYNDESNEHEGEPCSNFIEQCENPLIGWLRWKKENKLLIDILIMP